MPTGVRPDNADMVHHRPAKLLTTILYQLERSLPARSGDLCASHNGVPRRITGWALDVSS
jgi:hypothetical protein